MHSLNHFFLLIIFFKFVFTILSKVLTAVWYKSSFIFWNITIIVGYALFHIIFLKDEEHNLFPFSMELLITLTVKVALQKGRIRSFDLKINYHVLYPVEKYIISVME